MRRLFVSGNKFSKAGGRRQVAAAVVADGSFYCWSWVGDIVEGEREAAQRGQRTDE